MSRRAVDLSLIGLGLVIVAWTAVMSAFEPVLLDGWFIERWDGGFADYVRANYTGELFWGNPRLGQWVTWLTYERAVHVVLTPVIVLALFLLMLAHLRGRWPNAGDAWALLALLGITVLAQPQLGPVLFYRPFTANYVVGLVVQLALMLPYRFAFARTPRGGAGMVIGMLVLGVAAGACNEHTGPALAAAGLVVCVRFARRGELRAWMIAGLVGFVAGYLIMMLAPAQATRYCGVATEAGLVERIADRGVFGNLKVIFALVIAGRWAWLALAVVMIAMRRMSTPRHRQAIAWLALGAAISLTLLASPKQGDRLLFAPLVFATIGIVVVLEDLVTTRLRRVIAIGAGGIVVAAIAWSVAVQMRVYSDLAERRALLAAAPRGSIVRVPELRHGPSRWFLGDDLPSDALRHRVAQMYGLQAIDLDGHPTIPYQFAIRYRLADGEPAADPRPLPLQLCEARRDFEQEVASLGSLYGTTLVAADLMIAPRERVFEGKPLAASRWRAGRIVAPRATVVNEGYTRWITLEPGGLTGDIVVMIVGPDRSERLVLDGGRYPYRPWQNGTYWVVACSGDDCYLAETVRHTQVASR